MATSKQHIFTSESVTEGHPDKVADQISDAVLDAILARDPAGRVACETLVTTGMAVVAGEITTTTYVHIPDLVRETVESIGYTDAAYGFDGRTCAVLTSIDRQSPDIAMGVDSGKAKEQGAGDQGMMFGYATSETRERMPLPIMLAHRIVERLAAVRKGLPGHPHIDWLRPDGKSQVSVEYEEDRPLAVRTVVVSTQHAERRGSRQLAQGTIREAVIEEVIKPVLDSHGLEYRGTKFLINPTGRFVIGGPHGDAGLTGRKIIVDTYGGMARHGGGAFSGKDPSKVDRSAAYAARWVAKNVVAAGAAKRCEVQVAYAIGVGHRVRMVLHGRRVGGWIVAVDVDPPAGVALRPLAKWSGRGPTPELIELAEWAAWRWAGRPASLLRTASPGRAAAWWLQCRGGVHRQWCACRRRLRSTRWCSPPRPGATRWSCARRRRWRGLWWRGCGGPACPRPFTRETGRSAPRGPRSWGLGPPPGRRWATSRRWWCSTSTTRRTSRSRRPRGMPGRWPWSGRAGRRCRASWPRLARRWRRWRPPGCSRRRAPRNGRAGPPW